MMIDRKIPSTGESLPIIGIGSWLQFDIDTSSIDGENLKRVLHKMHQCGAKLIDSSPMYGRSEGVIGELTNEIGMQDDFFYATKVWTNGKQAGIDQMKNSMAKMKRSVIDLVQVHNVVDWRTHLETLRQWKSDGLIRYIGITHYVTSAHEQLEEIIRQEPIDFVQFNYSIETRNAEKSLLPLANEKGVAVIINEPFEKGRLFEKVRMSEVPAWALDYDIKTWAAFFLKYIVSHPAVTCVIPATSNPIHMEDNMSAGEGYLPNEHERKQMADYFDSL